jgi:hypothetical protein
MPPISPEALMKMGTVPCIAPVPAPGESNEVKLAAQSTQPLTDGLFCATAVSAVAKTNGKQRRTGGISFFIFVSKGASTRIVYFTANANEIR